jgi:hypothetical protein
MLAQKDREGFALRLVVGSRTSGLLKGEKRWGFISPWYRLLTMMHRATLTKTTLCSCRVARFMLL